MVAPPMFFAQYTTFNTKSQSSVLPVFQYRQLLHKTTPYMLALLDTVVQFYPATLNHSKFHPPQILFHDFRQATPRVQMSVSATAQTPYNKLFSFQFLKFDLN